MLNTQKLLYILPDVAYVTELLPAKKPNSFSIQSFRQINGEFMDEDIFITKNIFKLFSKLDAGEYHLILPDFLFTNTILNITETNDQKIKTYLNDILLPQLNLSTVTHELQTFVLTEFKGISKVQLSAIEKSLLSPMRVASEKNKVEISGISPLSWTIKSLVSLEPSITVLQIGTQLYTALQYIGVDQATITPVSETDAVAETIKTLRGAEPSIQTVYLLTNDKVEQELKELVSDTLPLQQLTSLKDEDSKMPSYVRQIVESSMRTLSIEDYPVPKFPLGKPSQDELQEFKAVVVEETELSDDLDDADHELPPKSDDIEDDDDEDAADEESKLDEGDTDKEPEADAQEDSLSEKEDLDVDEELPTPSLPVGLVAAASTTVLVSEFVKPPIVKAEVAEVAATEPEEVMSDSKDVEQEEPKPISKAEVEDKEPEIDLAQFASHASSAVVTPHLSTLNEKPDEKNEVVSIKPKKVIKNSSGIGNMLKMVFITLAVFAITVAVGVGAGLTLLSMTSSNDSDPTTTPTPVESVAPEPSATPEASAAAEIKQEDFSILIVNATTKAGYAGATRAELVEAGYSEVVAANAKGEYEPGMFVLMPEENKDLLAQLIKDSKLELEFAEGYETEDTQKQYDAVVVLAE
jgi:hypothetical protein